MNWNENIFHENVATFSATIVKNYFSDSFSRKGKNLELFFVKVGKRIFSSQLGKGDSAMWSRETGGEERIQTNVGILCMVAP